MKIHITGVGMNLVWRERGLDLARHTFNLVLHGLMESGREEEGTDGIIMLSNEIAWCIFQIWYDISIITVLLGRGNLPPPLVPGHLNTQMMGVFQSA